MTDMDALEKYARHRDAQAFRHLVLAHQGLVHGVCARVLGDDILLQDAVQDTFIKLAENAHRIRGNLASWLHSCARRCALDRIRSESARHRRERSWAELQQEHLSPARFQELLGVLDECLAELPEAEREMVVRHYYEGQTLEACARACGITAPGFRKRLDKAVERLRERLAKKGVVLGAALLAAHLAQASASAVPVTLTASLTKIGVAGVGKTSTVAGGGIVMTSTLKAVVGAVAGLAILAGITLVAVRMACQPEEPEGRQLLHAEGYVIEHPADLRPVAEEFARTHLAAVRTMHDAYGDSTALLRQPGEFLQHRQEETGRFMAQALGLETPGPEMRKSLGFVTAEMLWVGRLADSRRIEIWREEELEKVLKGRERFRFYRFKGPYETDKAVFYPMDVKEYEDTVMPLPLILRRGQSFTAETMAERCRLLFQELEKTEVLQATSEPVAAGICENLSGLDDGTRWFRLGLARHVARRFLTEEMGWKGVSSSVGDALTVSEIEASEVRLVGGAQPEGRQDAVWRACAEKAFEDISERHGREFIPRWCRLVRQKGGGKAGWREIAAAYLELTGEDLSHRPFFQEVEKAAVAPNR